MDRSLSVQYRQPFFGRPDPRLRRALALSSSLGVAVLLVVLLAPVRVAPPPRVDEVPERLAKLILEERKPPPVLAPAPARVEAPELAQVEEPKLEPEVAPAEPKAEPRTAPVESAPRRPREEPRLAEDAGTVGRARAKSEVRETLAGTTESMARTLESVSSDLSAITGSDGSAAPARRGGRGRPGKGRSSGEVGGAVAARDDVGAGAGGGGVVVTGDLIDIESVGGSGAGGDLASADPGAAGGGAFSGSYRSNASLLAVVRKYAAGIQFCYDNQLKRNPGLEGKMVVVLTVLASGRVSEASIADDTLGSSALRECVLTQVREWKFPAIPDGVVTFRTPFVFTPPN